MHTLISLLTTIPPAMLLTLGVVVISILATPVLTTLPQVMLLMRGGIEIAIVASSVVAITQARKRASADSTRRATGTRRTRTSSLAA